MEICHWISGAAFKKLDFQKIRFQVGMVHLNSGILGAGASGG